MNYAELKEYDVADGEGVRVSLFVSGCRKHCKGCHNAAAWSFDYGKPFTEATAARILDLLAQECIAGLSILGGEPFEAENLRELVPFVKRVREAFPAKSIWCYTGYLHEDLMKREDARALLALSDVLVDGEFIEARKVLGEFRGSSNQRIIRLKHDS